MTAAAWLVTFVAAALSVAATGCATAQHTQPRAIVLLGDVRVPYPDSTPAHSVAEQFLRSRLSQLQFCYVERGRRGDLALAGFLQVSFHLPARRVVDSLAVRSLSPTWRGLAAERAQDCIRQKVKSWRFPEAARTGTYFVTLGFAMDSVPLPWPGDWGPRPRPTGGIAP